MPTFMRRAFCLLLSVACVAAVSGCRKGADSPGAGPGGPSTVGSTSQTPSGGDNSAVAVAVNRQVTLASIRGKAVIRMYDAPSRFKLGVNADLVASQSEGFLRIKAEKLAGTIKAFELYKDRDEVALYVPMENSLYTGSVRDCDRMGMPIKPDEILEQLLRPDTELLMHTWKPVASNDRNTVAFEDPSRELRVMVDRRSGLISVIEQRDRNGQVFLRKTLENYRGVDLYSGMIGRVANNANQKVYPFTQRIEWPRDQRRVEIHFKRVNPNDQLTDNDFDLAVPQNVRQLPLDRARIESDND